MFEEFKQAFQRYNNAPAQLIIINIVVFILLGVLNVISTLTEFPGLFEIVHENFMIPARLSDFITKPWTMLTYMFAHDLSGILHILFNMLVLYWFGKIFVEYLGSDKLIAVYVMGGLAGAALYLLAYNTIPYYHAQTETVNIVMKGASASVNAIVVATAVLLPNYTFFLLFFGPVRIKYIAAFYVVISFLGTVGSNEGGNIAHLGGALLGFVYMKQLQAGSNWGTWVTVTLDWIKGLFKPRSRVKVSYRKESGNTARPPQTGGKNYTQDEIDAILDKISAGGYESLTKEEKEKLFNASKNK